MNETDFSVCQFFHDDTCEYVRRYVDVKDAMAAFIHYTNNVATSMGVVERVIITDGLDFTVMEWKRGQGITFPPEAVGRSVRPDWKERLDANP